MARRLDHIRERPSGSRCGGELDLDGLTQPDPDVQVRRYFGPGLATHREAILGETPPRQDLPPVIRIEPSAGRTVTWAGFVEAGLLRTYRNAQGGHDRTAHLIDCPAPSWASPTRWHTIDRTSAAATSSCSRRIKPSGSATSA